MSKGAGVTAHSCGPDPDRPDPDRTGPDRTAGKPLGTNKSSRAEFILSEDQEILLMFTFSQLKD